MILYIDSTSRQSKGSLSKNGGNHNDNARTLISWLTKKQKKMVERHTL